MAIADSRVSLKNIATKTKSSFIDAVDKTKDLNPTDELNKTLSASIESTLNKKAISAGMNGFTNKLPKPSIGLNSKLGLFNNVLGVGCDLNLFKGDYSFDIRDFNLNFNLGFGFDGFKIDFGCVPSLSSTINNILNAKNDILKSIASIKDKTIGKLERAISNVVNNIHKAVGKGIAAINGLKAAGKVVNSLGAIGTSIKSKNLIKELAVLCSENLDSLSISLLDVLNGFLLEAALSVSNCLDSKNTLVLASKLIETGIATPTEVITGFTKNFKSNEDPHIIPKMHTLATLLKDTESIREPSSSVSTKNHVDVILKSLNNSDSNTEGPASDYHITIDTLNMLDSNWNKDKDGNTNYDKVKGNKYMKKLASANLTTTSPSSELTLSPTISDDKRMSIGIMASCSSI